MSDIKKIKTLTIAAMVTALGIVVGFFKIPITNLLEIRFNTIPLALAGKIFGPYTAGIVGILIDIGSYIIRPTGPYFPGFTLSNALSGVIFGFLLRPKKGTHSPIYRITIAVILNTVFINMILNSVWLMVLYGKESVIAVLSVRLLKEIVLIPVNIIIIAALTKPVEMLLRINEGKNNAGNDIQTGN